MPDAMTDASIAVAAARLNANQISANRVPVPANVAGIASTAPRFLPLFGKHLLRMPDRITHHGDACIHAALQQHFANFLFRAAIVARSANVRLKFMLALQRSEQGYVDETAGFERQALARPQFAPDVARRKLAQRHRET